MNRKQASDYDQALLDLYDDYAHGRIDRRGFLRGAAKFAVGGLTAEALLASLSPNYAWAQQVAKDDPRIKTAVSGLCVAEGGREDARLRSCTLPRWKASCPPWW